MAQRRITDRSELNYVLSGLVLFLLGGAIAKSLADEDGYGIAVVIGVLIAMRMARTLIAGPSRRMPNQGRAHTQSQLFRREFADSLNETGDIAECFVEPRQVARRVRAFVTS
jgi:hypothetical protein